MKLHDVVLVEKMSIDSVETSGRIHKGAMAGSYAVLQGKKVWKSNLSSPAEARSVIKTYNEVKPGHPPLRVVFLTK